MYWEVIFLGKNKKLVRRQERKKRLIEGNYRTAYLESNAYITYSPSIDIKKGLKPIPLSDRSSNKSIPSYDLSTTQYNPLKPKIVYTSCTLKVKLDDNSFRYVSSSYHTNSMDALHDAENMADDFIEMLWDKYDVFGYVEDSTFEDVSEDDLKISDSGIHRRSKTSRKRRSYEQKLAHNESNAKWKRRYYKTKLGRQNRREQRKAWKKRYYKTKAGKKARNRYR